ncbi:MAG: enoyl-CoA hydratase/isomerase family protein [Dehalococcoidia bacterium]|nr:enoyl-CoA hydratase/isomerase family protein [Dehalococcoidia bacterium]
MWSAWERVAGFDLEELTYEKKYRDRGGGVARICSNRPHRMNALTNKGWGEIVVATMDAQTDKDIGVIVISGVGDHFGVGGDMQWEAAGGLQALFQPTPEAALEKAPETKPETAPSMAGGFGGGFDSAIMECAKPVIAAVKGYCIGGHNHLAYHCDFTIAADNAILGQNGARIASPIHGYLVSSLAHVVGIKKAKEVWMLCRRYTAQEALQMGLVNAVVPLSKLEETVDQWCEELLNLVPSCLALMKRSFVSIDKYMEADMGKILGEVAPDFFSRPEVAEAHQAFFEKRTPDFWKESRKASS